MFMGLILEFPGSLLTEFLKTSRFKFHIFIILRQRAVQQNASCRPFMIHTKTKDIVLWWSAEDELSLTAWRKKLLCSLVAQQQILLYLLPDGRRVNKLWVGWILSFCILWALHRHLSSLISLMVGKWVPVIFCAILITHCRVLLSWAMHVPSQFVMIIVRMLSFAPL